MNDRKRAWQILHTEICLRERGVPDPDTCERQVSTIVGGADGVIALIIELAGFGASYAHMSADECECGHDAVDLR